MHTDAAPNKKPTGDGNPTAGHTDTRTVSNPVDADKAFASLQAAYALKGHSLHRIAPSDSGAAYWAERWGLVKHLPTIDAARRFLDVVGGAAVSDPTERFRLAIAAAGLEAPDTIHADGKIHRFSTNGRRGNDSGWYLLHLDGVHAGCFGNWRDGYSQCWSAKDERTMSAADRKALAQHIEAMRRQRDAEQQQRHADAAAAALLRWAAAAPAVTHPYLSAKRVKPHGTRVDGHQLFVPMRDAAGKLHSLQTIGPDGEKRFMPGGRVRGCYHAIGKPSVSLIVCEGYATGATLHEATGYAVAVAFNAGNLQAAAVSLRAKYPCLTIIIAADDDWKTPGNPGLTAAQQAAQAVGGKVAVPDFTGLQRGDKDTDYNDLQRLAEPVQIGGAA